MVSRQGQAAKQKAPRAARPDPVAVPGGGSRSERLTAQIRQLIETEKLKPGDRLPSERQLAARFGVSRGSVRQSLQYLTIMGRLEIRRGGGSYLQAARGAAGDPRDRWRQWVRDHRGKVLETLEVRLGAEAFAAGLAAQRATPEDLERLLLVMRSMREICAADPIDTARFIECDIAFHDALLQAGGNKILRDLIQALGEELLPERAAVTALEGRVQQTYREHLDIFEAIRTGDSDGAAEAMRRHIVSVRRDVLVRVLEGDRMQSIKPSAARGASGRAKDRVRTA